MSAFESFNRLRQCRHGLMLYNVNDIYVGRSLDLYGEYSEREISVFRQFLVPGMTVVEAGANLGAHTVFLAQAVGPSGRVIAFEPQRLIFQTLCANMALNHFTNVDCRMAALGRAPGQTIVPRLNYHQANNFGGLALGRYTDGEPVPAVALDDLNLPVCTLLKVDVEGMEIDVLTGAKATIARCRPVLYVENDRSEKSAELIGFIDALGYDMYWYCTLLFNPDNFAGNQENVFGMAGSFNMICSPRGGRFEFKGFPPVESPTIPMLNKPSSSDVVVA